VTLSGHQLRELASLLATLTVYAKARSQTDIADRAHAFIASVVYRPKLSQGRPAARPYGRATDPWSQT
jgi:hypothetical protein